MLQFNPEGWEPTEEEEKEDKEPLNSEEESKSDDGENYGRTFVDDFLKSLTPKEMETKENELSPKEKRDPAPEQMDTDEKSSPSVISGDEKMSKHYNLTVTDDNGKSVTTSNTSTEHAEEILRMMQLAGMQDSSCGCGESIEENEYQPTPANDKLDLDDYSKKSGESIPKQKKSLDKAPSRGDNPLEYSLDENEIFESLMNEFEEVEEDKVNFR